MYRLVVSPSHFRPTYIEERLYKWFLAAWLNAWLITLRNPYSLVEVQKKVA